ncbi:hypothetical protein PENSPDRAFT_734940 [Peniophora sp. CONT]|nr:hypothetical protein PENSPDRAFT_734940 [Peniophora sp. CONT]
MSYSDCPPQRLSVQQHFETVFQAWVTQLANTNCIQNVIIERRRRLFPEGDLDFYTPLDDEAFWIDLPPELLLPSELNLVHEPSIFDSPVYIPWLDVMAQLTFAHHYGALRSHLREQGVSEQCFEAPVNATRMGDTIYQCILAQTQRTDVPVGQCYAFKAPRAYPRSIYTSPRRNAGGLFRTDWSDNILRTLFADGADGKRYFLNQLCRLPVDYMQCRPRSQPIILALALYTDELDFLTWEGLVTGRTRLLLAPQTSAGEDVDAGAHGASVPQRAGQASRQQAAAGPQPYNPHARC